MNIKEIKLLLKKFYDGETSLEEENILNDFFSKNDMPYNLKPYQLQFEYYQQAKKDKISDTDFDKKILQKINQSKIVSINKSKKTFLYVISGIAASILLLIFFYVQLNNKPEINYSSRITDTYKDPKMAYNETKTALLSVSEKMNYGLYKMNDINKINKGIKDVYKISEFNKGINELNKLKSFNKAYKLLNNFRKVNK